MKKPPKYLHAIYYPKDIIQQVIDSLPNPFLATMDKPTFVLQVMGSLSLKHEEKLRVLNAIPTLSQFQIDELIKVFTDEVVEFTKLLRTEDESVHHLSISNIYENFKLLESLYVPFDRQNFMAISIENIFLDHPSLELRFKKQDPPFILVAYRAYNEYKLRKGNTYINALDEEI